MEEEITIDTIILDELKKSNRLHEFEIIKIGRRNGVSERRTLKAIRYLIDTLKVTRSGNFIELSNQKQKQLI